MEIESGQIWKAHRRPLHYEDSESGLAIVTGAQDFIWYMPFKQYYYHYGKEGHDGELWRRAKENGFMRHFEYTGHQIKAGTFWKSRATGVPVRIMGVKDNGINKMMVLFDLNKFDVDVFYHYYEPCTEFEIQQYLSYATVKVIEQHVDDKKRSGLDNVLDD